MVIVLFFCFVCSLSAFPQFDYYPQRPQRGDTLKIIFHENDFSRFGYYFDRPFLYQEDGFLKDNTRETGFKKEIILVVPEDASLFGFYLIDGKDREIKSDGDDYFMFIYDSLGLPVRDAYFNKSYVMFQNHPNYYKIKDWLKEEIRLYPSNYKAHYFLWNFSGLFENYPEKIKSALENWPYPVVDSGAWFFFQYSVNNRLENYDEAYYQLLQAYSKTRDHKTKKRVLSKLTLYSDSLWESDSLLNKMMERADTPEDAKAFDHYLYFLANRDSSKWSGVLDRSLNSTGDAVKERALYHYFYSEMKREKQPFEELKRRLDNVFPPSYLSIAELNRMVSVMSFFEEFKPVMTKYAEFTYSLAREQYEGYLNNNGGLMFNIIENYAYALYLEGKFAKAYSVSRELFDFESMVFDDITSFRLGLIAYQDDRYEEALRMIGKSYIENLREEVFQVLKDIFEEREEASELPFFLKNLKKNSYTKIPLERLSLLPDYYPGKKSFVLLYHPDSPLPLPFFNEYSEMVEVDEFINSFVLYPDNYGFDEEWESFFIKYGFHPVVVEQEVMSLFSSHHQKSQLILMDSEEFIINRLDPYRPDWLNISKSFIKE